MTLASPEVKKLITEWQEELRRLTESNAVLLVTFDPGDRFSGFNQIVDVVCEATGVPFARVLKRDRQKDITLTRHLIAYYSVVNLGLTTSTVAKALKLANHTTVMHAKNRIIDLLDINDPLACNAVYRINQKLAHA